MHRKTYIVWIVYCDNTPDDQIEIMATSPEKAARAYLVTYEADDVNALPNKELYVCVRDVESGIERGYRGSFEYVPRYTVKEVSSWSATT